MICCGLPFATLPGTLKSRFLISNDIENSPTSYISHRLYTNAIPTPPSHCTPTYTFTMPRTKMTKADTETESESDEVETSMDSEVSDDMSGSDSASGSGSGSGSGSHEEESEESDDNKFKWGKKVDSDNNNNNSNSGFGHAQPSMSHTFGGHSGFGGGFGGGFAGKGGMGFRHNNMMMAPQVLPGSREEVINEFIRLNGRLAEFRESCTALENFERINDLGFQLAESEEVHEKLEGRVERAVDQAQIERVQAKLAQNNRVAIDQIDLTVLRGLHDEKQREEERANALKQQIVAEKVAEKEQFLAHEFHLTLALENANEVSRDIERKYMKLQAGYLRQEIVSQKRLFLRISRARCGDTTKDDEELRAEAALKEKWAAMDRDYQANLMKVKKVMQAAKDAVKLPPLPKVSGKRVAESSPPAEKKRKIDTEPQMTEAEKEARYKELSSQLYGLSHSVKLYLWDQMKDASWKKLLLAEAQQPYFTYLNNVCILCVFELRTNSEYFYSANAQSQAQHSGVR